MQQQNNELSATGILSLLETTKEQRQSFVQSVVQTIKDGDADPIKIHLQIKNTEDLVKQMTSDPEYRKLCLDESAKYGKSFERFNAKFETKEMGTKYDYSVCNDPEYIELEQASEKAKAALKVREEFLKRVPATGIELIDANTAEIYTIYPPVKTSTTSLTVTLK